MKKLGVINGLRGLSILAVVYHHLFYRSTAPGYRSFQVMDMTVLPFTYLANGWLGVNLFFFLSGFVLAYPYFCGTRLFATKEDFKWFYIHRAKRLLPLYYFMIVFAFIFLIKPFPINDIFYNLFIYGGVLFNYTFDSWFPIGNWVLWSLGIEVWFSVVFPFVVMAVYRYGMGKVLLFSVLGALAFRFIGNAESFRLANPYLNPVKDSLIGRFDEFIWGVFLCYLYVKRKDILNRIQPMVVFSLGTILITVACFMWDYVILKKAPILIIPIINNFLDLGIFFITMSLLVMKNNVLRRLFESYPLQLHGMMCYSIYVWHGITLTNIVHENTFPQIASYLFLLLAISVLSYRYIEFGNVADTKKLFLVTKKA